MTDLKKENSDKNETISPKMKAKLLKKWKSILTRYSKLRDNNWIKIRVRGMTTVRVDCSKNRVYYTDQINNAIKIIQILERKSEI